MRDGWLSLYHHLPHPVRSAAATMRGLYLRHWRYSRATERLIDEATERERWSPERWRAWSEERTAYILHRAATRVPYYRDHWERRRRVGDHTSWQYLEHWPILEKDELRGNPRRFIADDADIRGMMREQTSGTTGKPLDVWRSRSIVEQLFALRDARTKGWYGIGDERWAQLGGQLVTPVRQRRPPFWVWNAAMGQLYMSTYHLAPDLIPHYLDALAKYRIRYVTGNPSALVALAQEAARLGRTDLTMMVAFTNAEPLHEEQRTIIAAAFQCPVVDTYGMTESVAHASRCPDGSLHLWPEVGHLEVMNDGAAARQGEAGEFVCTGLLNDAMPLIRYQVGDRGTLARPGARCACGRSLPLLARVEGRSTALILTRDGRQILWINAVFYGLPVRQSQVVQESLDHLTVRVAPGMGFSADTGRTIVERLKNRLGTVSVQLLVVPTVPRAANGPPQDVICRLSPEQRASVLHCARGGLQVVA